jgi:hypothetical protein
MILLIAAGIAVFADAESRILALGFSLFGCLWVGIAGVVYWLMSGPIGFDRTAGYFWKGGPGSAAATSQCETMAPLDWIHAIQLIRESVEGGESPGNRPPGYLSYEINLVLRDGCRINVVDHANIYRIQQDARQLGEFLDVPVWDNT